MSILVCMRLKDNARLISPENVRLTSVQSRAALDALAAWGLSDELVRWREVSPVLLNDSWDSKLLDEASREQGLKTLLILSRQGTGLAIWYAGFHDDVPKVDTPDDFMVEIESQIFSGEDEPACVFLMSEESSSGRVGTE